MGTVDDQILSSRILIVDEKPTNVLLLEEVLASQDYTNVCSTQDPREVKALQLEHDIRKSVFLTRFYSSPVILNPTSRKS
jgi:CheY-like chemotaxis protein